MKRMMLKQKKNYIINFQHFSKIERDVCEHHTLNNFLISNQKKHLRRERRTPNFHSLSRLRCFQTDDVSGESSYRYNVSLNNASSGHV